MDWSLYVITDPKLSRGRSHLEVARAAIAGGASVFQLRDKEASTKELVESGLKLREITRELGVTFIVNDRVDVALVVEADGVHLGQDDMPIRLARKLMGPERIVGASAGSVEEALRAEREGADYLGVGSVFATGTKPDARPPIGLEGLREIVRAARIPVVAIGGINEGNVGEAIRAGADGVAVISAVVGAPDIAEAARRLVREIERARRSGCALQKGREMRIAQIGEFGLIERIRGMVGPPSKDVIVGIGDDVAVLRTDGGNYLLATCDIQIEGIHFVRDKITPYQLGRKAVAINLSDIAAMGGLPRYLLVSLGLPKDTTVEYVDSLYEGIREEAGRFGVSIVGGNIARSPSLMVDIFLLGEVEPECLLLRSGAQVGDLVLVTGQVGDSAAGLSLLLDPVASCEEDLAKRALKAHLTPTPRLREGRVIARSGAATAMIDISDGLASDIAHICEESKVGVRIWAERLPISAVTRAVAAASGKDPLDLALFGGEDYELLFTAPPERAEELAAAVLAETGTPVTVVGEIASAAEGKMLMRGDGESVPLDAGGWDHFRL